MAITALCINRCLRFVGRIAPGGRIVNVSSGSASMWLREQSAETKALFANPDISWPELDAVPSPAKEAFAF